MKLIRQLHVINKNNRVYVHKLLLPGIIVYGNIHSRITVTQEEFREIIHGKKL